MDIDILPSESVFVAGMMGSGKSFLAETYLTGYQTPVIKLDTKNETGERKNQNKSAWTNLVEDKDFEIVYNLADISQCTLPKIIYVPDIEEQTLEFFNSFFKWVYMRTNTTVWVDELMSVCDSALRYPMYFKACMTRGRSKNVSCWNLTQQPVSIPSVSYANSSHFFIFNMARYEDRDKMAQATGFKELKNKPGKYNFWYTNTNSDRAIKGRMVV